MNLPAFAPGALLLMGDNNISTYLSLASLTLKGIERFITFQRRIQNPMKHLTWDFSQK